MMLHIDLPTDLNAEEDDGFSVARLSRAADPRRVRAGAVLVAGHPDFWSWVLVDSIEDGVVRCRQITMNEAAKRANLVDTVA